MKNYLKLLLNNYKQWKRFKQFPDKVKVSKRIPSETYMKYPPFETFKGKKVLNIGCGRCVYKVPNVINVDAVKNDGINLVQNLDGSKPLPFEDETFDLIIANHVLEHLPNWWETFKEMARVLKTNGIIEVWVPPVSSDSAHTYRDHINLIGPESFSGINNWGRNGTNLVAGNEINSLSCHVRQLDLINKRLRPIITWWTMIAPFWLLDWMADHLRNTVSEVGFFFIKREVKKNV